MLKQGKKIKKNKLIILYITRINQEKIYKK